MLRFTILGSLLVALSVASVLRGQPSVVGSEKADGSSNDLSDSPQPADTAPTGLETTMQLSQVQPEKAGHTETALKNQAVADEVSVDSRKDPNKAGGDPKRSLTMLTMMLLNPGSNTTSVATGSSGGSGTVGTLVGTLRTLLSYVLSLLSGLTGSLGAAAKAPV